MECLDCNLKDVEVNLLSFYPDVIRKDLNVNTASENKHTLNQLRKKYSKKFRQSSIIFSLDFESPAVRAAYVFYYCPFFTSALISGFGKFLTSVPDYTEKMVLKDTLTVCCLGGGPGPEIVAIFSIVQGILSNRPLKREKPLVINATVADADPGWADTAKRVVSKLQELADAAVLQLNVSFVEHDLVAQPVTEALKKILNASDIVTMVEFISALHGASTQDTRSKIIQDVCGCMKEDAILFLLDSSGGKSLVEVTETISSCLDMTSIYGPTKQTYKMSKASKQTCLRNSEQHGLRHCPFRITNKFGAWCKKPTEKE